MDLIIKLTARLLAYVMLAAFCLATGDLYAWQLRLQNTTDQNLVLREYAGECFGIGPNETKEYRVARPRLVQFYIGRIDNVTGNTAPVNIDNTGSTATAWVDQDLTDTQGRYIRISPQTFYGALPACQVYETGYVAPPSGGGATTEPILWDDIMKMITAGFGFVVIPLTLVTLITAAKRGINSTGTVV